MLYLTACAFEQQRPLELGPNMFRGVLYMLTGGVFISIALKAENFSNLMFAFAVLTVLWCLFRYFYSSRVKHKASFVPGKHTHKPKAQPRPAEPVVSSQSEGRQHQGGRLLLLMIFSCTGTSRRGIRKTELILQKVKDHQCVCDPKPGTSHCHSCTYL